MKVSAMSDTSGSFQELSALVFYIIDLLFSFDIIVGFLSSNYRGLRLTLFKNRNIFWTTPE